MASSYNIIHKIILLSFLLFCCLCNLVSSQGRNSYSTRIQSRSFSCLSAGNASVSFRNNVNILLSDFNQQSSVTSYYNTSTRNSPDRVYGYYMCRADVSLEVCHSCILNGTQFATEADCDQIDGTYFAEMCIFRYSNHSMYGLWENTVSVADYIEANVSNYQQCNLTLSSTLEDLINEAAFESRNNGFRLGFATHEANVIGDETIYSMAQCTPDIVGVNCSRCLRSALSCLRDGAPAAYVTMNKCLLRHDNVSFYDIGGPNVNIGTGLRSSNLLTVYSVVFLIVYSFLVLL